MSIEHNQTDHRETSRTWLWVALGAAAIAGVAAIVLSRRREGIETIDMLLDTCNNALSTLDERLLQAAS